jgi:hypothetical protein
VIWNEKVHFLQDAIDTNPYKSTHFVWADIGSQRWPKKAIVNWPAQRMMDLNHDRVIFRMISAFNEAEMKDPEILAREKGLYDRLCG